MGAGYRNPESDRPCIPKVPPGIAQPEYKSIIPTVQDSFHKVS
jgi:hypothetical protein